MSSRVLEAPSWIVRAKQSESGYATRRAEVRRQPLQELGGHEVHAGGALLQLEYAGWKIQHRQRAHLFLCLADGAN